MFRVLVLPEGPWGVAVAQHLTSHAPPGWEVCQASRGQPLRGSSPDLLVVLAEGASLLETLPERVVAIRPTAVVAPVEDPDWLPRPEQKRLAAACAARSIPCCFPSPFCALANSLSVPIADFAHHFGRPRLQIVTDHGHICEAAVLTDTPCGFARQAAPKLRGLRVEEAEAHAWDLSARCPFAALGRGEPSPYFALAVRLALESFDKVVAPTAGGC